MLISLISVLGLAFYWYSYRPSQLKQQCYADAEFDSRATTQPDDAKRQEFINNYYSDCITRWGLK